MSATKWKVCAVANPSPSCLRYLTKPRVCALFTTAFSVLAEKAFSASTLKAVVNNAQTRGLVRYRRQLGLGFATAHTFHLVALILFLSNLEGYSVDASVAVAGFGYVVTALLALSSNDYSVRRLGPVV